MWTIFFISLILGTTVSLDNDDPYEPVEVEMSKSRTGDLEIPEVNMQGLAQYKPMIGYLLNAFTVTTILLVVANILNINLFPSLAQPATRSLNVEGWKTGRSLETGASETIAGVVEAALNVFSQIDKDDEKSSGEIAEHVWKVEEEVVQ